MLKGFIRILEKVLSHSRLGIRIYKKPYEKIVRNEVALAKIKATDTVCLVGAGSIPFTAIWLVHLSGASVIAVDNDKKAVKNAKRVVRKLGLETSVSIRLQDGQTPLGTKVDVYLLAMQAQPLDAIILSIKEENPDARIVARVAKPWFERRYDTLPETIRIEKEVAQEFGVFEKSVLFRLRD